MIKRRLTPNGSREGDEYAEPFGVVLGTCIWLETFQNPHHDGEDDDLPRRAHREGDIGDSITGEGLKVGVGFNTVIQKKSK